MRIDKYLKVARIIKRRTIAKQLADNDRIKINDKIVKASTEVKVDDLVEVIFGHKVFKFKVLAIKEFIKKDEYSDLFEVIEA